MKEIKKGQRVLSVDIKQVKKDDDYDANVALTINVGPNYKVNYNFKDVDDALKFVNHFGDMLMMAKYGKDYKEKLKK